MTALEQLKARIAEMPHATDQTVVTRRYLEQLAEELAAAQSAEQLQGQAFGLKGQSL